MGLDTKTDRLTDWLTVSRKVTLTLTREFSFWVALQYSVQGVAVLSSANAVRLFQYICVYGAIVINIIEQFDKWLSLHIYIWRHPTTALKILSSLLFTNHLTIWCYIVWDTDNSIQYSTESMLLWNWVRILCLEDSIQWNWKVHYHAHKNLTLVPIPSHMNSVCTIWSYFSKTRYNVILLPIFIRHHELLHFSVHE
jgi:hypothetical protein